MGLPKEDENLLNEIELLEQEKELGSSFVKKLIVIIDQPEAWQEQSIIDSLHQQYLVKVINDPFTGIDYVQNFQPEAVLINLEQSDWDALDVIKRIHKHPLTQDIPILSITSDPAKHDRKALDDYGNVGFVITPVTRDIVHEIQGNLESLTKVIESFSNNRSFMIFYNHKQKLISLKNMINLSHISEDKLLILSWVRGSELFEESNQILIENEQIVYLEIKSSLIVKYPYLQDLSPIINEIADYCKGLDNYHLILDEPSQFIRISEDLTSLGQAHNFANLLHAHFSRITVLSTKPKSSTEEYNMHRLGRVIIGE